MSEEQASEKQKPSVVAPWEAALQAYPNLEPVNELWNNWLEYWEKTSPDQIDPAELTEAQRTVGEKIRELLPPGKSLSDVRVQRLIGISYYAARESRDNPVPELNQGELWNGNKGSTKDE